MSAKPHEYWVRGWMKFLDRRKRKVFSKKIAKTIDVETRHVINVLPLTTGSTSSTGDKRGEVLGRMHRLDA